MSKPDGRKLVTAAKRAGWPVRTKGGHTIVTLPSKRIMVLVSPGRSTHRTREIDAQLKLARSEGLDI